MKRAGFLGLLRGRVDKLIALCVGISLVLLFLYSQKPSPRPVKESLAEPSEAVEVVCGTAERIPIPVSVEGIGTVRSRRQTEIASRILSAIEEIRVEPGDRVKEGDVLVVLDGRDLRARVEESEATLRSLEERYSEAQREFERTRKMFAEEAATEQALDLARSRLAETAARKEAAAKDLEQARIQSTYAEIKAPFSGLIHQRAVDPGDLAAPGRALLGLYDPSELRLEALVEEEHLWKLEAGDELTVRIDSLGESFTGSVSEIVPAVDPLTRTGTIKIALLPEERIRPGMFGRAGITVGSREAIVIPREAAQRRGQLEVVFAVPEGGSETRARMRLVRFGLPVEGERVEVLSGLGPGTRVIIKGPRGLADGTRVRIRAPGEEPAGAPREGTEESAR